MAIGWTCVISAEIVGTQLGLGSLIWTSRKEISTPPRCSSAWCASVVVVLILDALFAALRAQARAPWMREVSVLSRRTGVVKRFGEVVALDGMDLEVQDRGRVPRHRRRVRLRQVDAAQSLRRLRGADRGERDAARRADRRRRAALRHGLPKLRALPVAHRRRQHRLRPRGARHGPIAARVERADPRWSASKGFRRPLPRRN